MNSSVMVLLPAFNEEKNLDSVLSGIRYHLPGTRIVVVNDGSKDRTREILEGHPDITALHHPFNLGIGGAIETGFRYFLQTSSRFLLRIDADGQHPPAEAKSLLGPLISGQADTVIGSRFLKKEGYQSSLTRRGGIKILNILSAFILGQAITDNTSGFKAYTRTAVESLIEDFPHDYPEPIEVYILSRKGMRIVEVPVRMEERREGLSSISYIETYYYLIKVLLTILVKHMIGGKK